MIVFQTPQDFRHSEKLSQDVLRPGVVQTGESVDRGGGELHRVPNISRRRGGPVWLQVDDHEGDECQLPKNLTLILTNVHFVI